MSDDLVRGATVRVIARGDGNFGRDATVRMADVRKGRRTYYWLADGDTAFGWYREDEIAAAVPSREEESTDAAAGSPTEDTPA